MLNTAAITKGFYDKMIIQKFLTKKTITPQKDKLQYLNMILEVL